MPSGKSPIHDSPSRARDEQTVIATGIKVETPEKRATPHPPAEPADQTDRIWDRFRPLVIFIAIFAAIAAAAIVYASMSLN